MAIININGIEYEGVIHTRPQDKNWGNRESKSVTLTMSYDEANALFVNNIEWFIEGDYLNTDGLSWTHYKTDLSDFALAGPIVDNRDGTITAKMGKYTETELSSIPVSVTPKTYKEAVELRQVIESAAQSLNDEIALTAKTLYPTWNELVEKAFIATEKDFKFRHNDDLYKTIIANASFVSHWIPGEGTESMYVKINETNTGSADDPIPYNGNMALENGKYYIQNDVIYLCIRDTVTPVYNDLIDLVDVYVTIG